MTTEAMAVSRLECTLLDEETIMAMPVDQRDVHTNLARWKERDLQDRCYRAVRDILGVPYGIENNPLMPPIMENPEVSLFGGRRGAGKSNDMAWWASFWRMRGYDALSNMSLLNTYILDDTTDVYALGYLWQNTPVFLDEMQMVSSTFEGPAHKTRMLMDFYSQLRKFNSPSYMASSQPHRLYGQIEGELTWYAKMRQANYRPNSALRWYPKWCHTETKYYGPFPIRYPDIAEKIFDDHEGEDLPSRWKHDSLSGHTAEAIWRASKINVSWETMTPGSLLAVSSDTIKSKISERNTARIIIDDNERQLRQSIILQIINMIKFHYLQAGQRSWEWQHVYQQMHQFAYERPLDKFDGYSEYNYMTPSMQEIKEALQIEANIPTRNRTLNLKDLQDRYPQAFQQEGA